MGTAAGREVKAEIVKDLAHVFKNSQGIVITDYRGLTVAEMTELRKQLKKGNTQFKVVKNSLALLAARACGLGEIESFLVGPTAVAINLHDPVIPAKLISEYSKNHKQLEIKGGVVQGRVVSKDQVLAIAQLPSREVLLGRVIGGAVAPLTKFLSVLNAPLASLVYGLDALRKQREAQQAS